MTRPAGRPTIGPKVEVRLPPDQRAWLDERRGGVPLPEMIRRLVADAMQPAMAESILRKILTAAYVEVREDDGVIVDAQGVALTDDEIAYVVAHDKWVSA